MGDKRLVQFYGENACDDAGRTWAEIVSWPDERLEAVHDFIQWLFPLPETSGANPSAPVLEADTVNAFQRSPEMQDRLRHSFLRMLRFYGLVWKEPGRIDCAENFALRAHNWLSQSNHNHLRLTRMMRSLRLLGLDAEAQALFAVLKKIYEEDEQAGRRRITSRTYRFWRDAAENSR